MAQIHIYGDIDSGSIFFLNSTVDPKALGTIEASLKSDEDRIIVKRTDRFEVTVLRLELYSRDLILEGLAIEMEKSWLTN